MTRIAAIFTLLFFVPAAWSSSPLEQLRARLDAIFSRVEFSNSLWGVAVVSLDRGGEPVYERNAGRLCLPASNTKLLTAAAALTALGPEYRYRTRVFTSGLIHKGVLTGDLHIVGSGDPTFAPRFHDGDPARRFKEWAARLKERGVASIRGALVADDRSISPTFGKGWAWDDLFYGYAAPVSALQFNENMLQLEIVPGEKPGQPVSLEIDPDLGFLPIRSELLTVEAGSQPDVEVERGPAETLVVRGSVPLKAGPILQTVAAPDPTAYFLTALRRTLRDEGIDVSACGARKARGTESPNGLVLLWEEVSPPLSEILPPLMKLSQNLYAEALVRTMGLELRGEGSFSKGREVVEGALEELGISRNTYMFADGSGVSRLNLLSADILVRLLQAMQHSERFPYFYNALAIAGVDGTLAGRLKGSKAENNVHAKTGSMAGVRTLSGYVRTADGELLAFSTIANNFLVNGRVAERAQDEALELLANFSRKSR
jgi:D-alanyl-D-alanine carboxypeptidase/D-alanyl-D-alanine-endopeptidase (penicillin-binding protein 4)